MTSNEYAIVTFHPHRQFHADGIQREKQYILLITDKFSMYTNDMLIKSELAEDLNAGLILLTTLTRNFQLNMTMNTQDKFNHNFNTVDNNACRALESEIQKQAPEGGSITQSQLIAATVSLNSLIHRKGKLSSIQDLHSKINKLRR